MELELELEWLCSVRLPVHCLSLDLQPSFP